ncbi:MAG: DUF192 domain-containing protein [Treponema sp.]|nr:DUF192 domain-containing protein [Treponema sp.]
MVVVKKYIPFCLFVFVSLFSASCFGSGKKIEMPVRDLEICTAGGERIPVKAEIAAKNPERQHGYMDRKKIPDGTGMLFVFAKDEVLNFWMKNTPHPLSIAYIDSEGAIVDIFDMTPFSLSNITSSRSVRYALEVPQGWFERVGISKGDIVQTADGSAIKVFQSYL